MYSYFNPLTLVSQDGTEQVVPPVWNRGESVKAFELAPIGPGEVVKILIGRKLESIASNKDQAGTIQEDILIDFSLR
jgi:hypothetical protein